MMKLTAALAAPFLIAGSVVASTSFLVVDVKNTADGVRIVVPVPIVLAQAAARFIPEDQAKVDLGEAREHLPAVRGLLKALAEAPDGELVSVEEPDETVRVAKSGDKLRVQVNGRRGETVDAQIPLETVIEILEGLEQGGHPADAIGALRGLSNTDLVEIHDGDDHIKVWVW